MQDGKISRKPHSQAKKGEKKKKRVAKSGAPRGERAKTRLRRERSERAREVLHVATSVAKVATKKRKKLSPQQKAAHTRRNSLTRTRYYEAHDRVPHERTRALYEVAEVSLNVFLMGFLLPVLLLCLG